MSVEKWTDADGVSHWGSPYSKQNLKAIEENLPEDEPAPAVVDDPPKVVVEPDLSEFEARLRKPTKRVPPKADGDAEL
jgi:hypothetical protein